jgi:hypothetical protein
LRITLAVDSCPGGDAERPQPTDIQLHHQLHGHVIRRDDIGQPSLMELVFLHVQRTDKKYRYAAFITRKLAGCI